MSTRPRTACHWTAPNGVPMSQWPAIDAVHGISGGTAQTYAEYVHDVGDTAVDQRDFELRRVRDVAALRDELERAEQQIVNQARDAGASWAAIGSALGISRQAAQQRFGRQP